MKMYEGAAFTDYALWIINYYFEEADKRLLKLLVTTQKNFNKIENITLSVLSPSPHHTHNSLSRGYCLC